MYTHHSAEKAKAKSINSILCLDYIKSHHSLGTVKLGVVYNHKRRPSPILYILRHLGKLDHNFEFLSSAYITSLALHPAKKYDNEC